MARLARVVVPGMPHHVTQRGNRRQQAFFQQVDYQVYLELMAEWCAACEVEIWSYCLMPNHIHLIAVPAPEGGLRRAIGPLARRTAVILDTSTSGRSGAAIFGRVGLRLLSWMNPTC